MFLWLAPFVIGSAVPVYRHGGWAVAGLAAGWFGVTAALIIVGENTTDAGLYDRLGWAFLLWLFILPVEALAVGAALIVRNRKGVAEAVTGPRSDRWWGAELTSSRRAIH